ncbi:hypothetical protein SAMN05421541_13636 [Actinoplanes philippinensis]|uniref:Uncharacterized protein n=1 Tax=Actinoplanes philippinensis TaxID=35752 RepID=A0A1I2N1S4_9ACTN|nr:hypothetical protein SAMN05421541_13636 [Actinoplanes philippinensis]
MASGGAGSWAPGAAFGLPAGGGAAMARVLVTVFGPALSGWQAELLAQPAVWAAPLASTGSLMTRGRMPADVGATMPAVVRPGSHAPGVTPRESRPGSHAPGVMFKKL